MLPLTSTQTIDHERIGTLALRSKLKKDKFLSSHPSIQSELSNTFVSDAAPGLGVIASKLESRLLSSKTLSKEVNMVILSLHSALKPSGDEGGEEEEDDDDDESSNRFHESQILADPPAAAIQRGAIDASEDSASDPDDDSSGSTDSARGSGSSQHGKSALFPRYSVFDRTCHSPPLSDDASQALGTESVFLPTLSNGFIPGGSDTDWSDGEARVADGVRKNRRGQRARRA